MIKKLKNKTIKLTSDYVQVIKGRIGCQINIKNLSVNNNTKSNMFLTLYILDKNQKKTVLVSNLTVPPLKNFNIPYEKNIELESEEFIFAQTKTKTDIDIFCNYIEIEKTQFQLQLQFLNQSGEIVTGVLYNLAKQQNGKQIIQFQENQKYTNIPEIYYKITEQDVIIYKNSNFELAEHNFKEYSDRYEINIYETLRVNDIFDILRQGFINVSFNILTTLTSNPRWRYNTVEHFTDLNFWNDPNIQISLTPDSYYLNFSDVDKFTTPSNFNFNINENNILNLKFDYISKIGTLKVLTDYSVPNLSWVLFDVDSGENLSEVYYLSSIVQLEEGLHTIKVFGIEELFLDAIYSVYINANQQHLLTHSQEYSVGEIQVVVGDSAEQIWGFSTIENDTINSWYDSSESISVSQGLYYLYFQNIPRYVSPNIKSVQTSDYTKLTVNTEYIQDVGTVSIQKPSLMSDSVANSIKWRIINKTTNIKSNWFTYLQKITTDCGEYIIEFQEVQDYFDSLTDTVFIYTGQQTIYLLNNSILN